MPETGPGSTFSISNGADDVNAGQLGSVEEVNAFLKQYATDHGHDEAMALTVWEMPRGGAAGKPHSAAEFVSS